MTNTQRITKAIQESGRKKKSIANELHITPRTLNSRLRNLSEFKASEILTLASILRLSPEDIMLIFFADDVILNHQGDEQ